jgi:hypothetical protein
MNKNLLERLRRKFIFTLYMPLKVCKEPSHVGAVVSDLFPIRNDEKWSTEFEFLNLPGLINGDISNQHKAQIVFFDNDGHLLGSRDIEIDGMSRKTIVIRNLLEDNLKNAATFAVFHSRDTRNVDLNGSFMAERGYAGYRYQNMSVKGYVHGNLDAVSYSGGVIQKLGNFGFPRKTYYVQHLLTGNAEYEFVFTNPTKRAIRIKPILETSNGDVKLPNLQISSLGCKLLMINVKSNEPLRIKFKSYLYLGRPVVFRLTKHSFDVFHG